MVIRYSYLWRDEARRGREEGTKDRPCAVVLTTRIEGSQLRVHVAPVTHSPPADPSQGLEIPASTKLRLGLDAARSWILTCELNIFTWPGYDLRWIGKAGDPRGYAFGMLPRAMTVDLVKLIVEQRRKGRFSIVPRDDR
jgi:hypothetical protein